MPQFSYKARRRSGEVVQGTLDVVDRAAALVAIERLGLFPVAVDAPKGGGPAKGNQRPTTAKAVFNLAADLGAVADGGKRKPNCRNWPRSRSSSPTCCKPACR